MATTQSSNIDALPPCEVLREAVRTGEVLLPGGNKKKLVAQVGVATAAALYGFVLKHRPGLVIEIGMAQGVSTLSTLSALSQYGGKMISVDPYDGWKSGRDAALYAIERAGFASLHTHMEAPSYSALPQLLAQGVTADFAYIDGAHDFGNAFIDAFYLDKMLKPTGVMAFNDTGWADVNRVIGHVRKRLKYRELDVGLKRDYRGRNALVTAARFVLQWPRQDRYFEKPETSA